jgi:hypothetical protein
MTHKINRDKHKLPWIPTLIKKKSQIPNRLLVEKIYILFFKKKITKKHFGVAKNKLDGISRAS